MQYMISIRTVIRNDENCHLSIEKKVSYQNKYLYRCTLYIIILKIYWHVLDFFKQCSIELSESIYKPYCEKHCIVSAGNS